MAWIKDLILNGSSKGICPQSQLKSKRSSYTFHWSAPRVKGPCIIQQRGPLPVQLSYQNRRLLSLPIVHMLPSLKIPLLFLIAFQICEHCNLSALAELIILWLQYFFLRTRAHRASFSTLNLQLSLASKAVFLPFANCKPRLPSSFDFVTFCHPTQWIFLDNSIDPQRKFIFTRSTPSRILLGM